MSHMKNRDSNKMRREDRIEQAKIRRELRADIAPAEQLAKLDAAGLVAAKERLQLQQATAKVEAPVVAEVAVEAASVEKPKKFKKGAKPKKEKKVKK